MNSGRQARILIMSIERKHLSKWPQKLKRRRVLCKTLPCKHCDKSLGEQGQEIVGLGVHLIWTTAIFNVDGRLITIYKKSATNPCDFRLLFQLTIETTITATNVTTSSKYL